MAGAGGCVGIEAGQTGFVAEIVRTEVVSGLTGGTQNERSAAETTIRAFDGHLGEVVEVPLKRQAP